ncbi:MAG TPA: DUF6530 family protein [Candidatus Krumholzibacteria bacterium]|nr:DUF6530 family protein [Candidatus Krumholzibacteria bacterium]HPD73112.1 DUF6530 family protein [Candidatus Krumholzibacteria bacterium]HRY41912.1 DUF6530 family protein [Candidatus Krumholzibacteria bacterium]
MRIPTTLKHKPVICCENYANIDGRFAGDTDAQGLSLGLAQWNDRGNVEISAKVWRFTGEKWSRQSEELPLHRALDLAILIARTLAHFRDAYRYEDLYDKSKPDLDRIGVQGDAMTVSVCTANPLIDSDIKLFRDALAKDDELLSERLHVLADLLAAGGFGHSR